MKKKRALITGASSGIGYVFAKELSKENYVVTGVARNEEKLKSLFQELGQGHDYVVADLTNPGQLAKIERKETTVFYQ